MEIGNLTIPDTEKENVQNLKQYLEIAAKGFGHNVNINVVGGAVTKEWPRKDIDLTLSILDLKNKLKGNALDKAEYSFLEMEKIVREVIESKSGYRIIETIKPYLDHEYEDPEIVAHNGSIVVSPRTGTPIEIINTL